jgi:hypothetical protein
MVTPARAEKVVRRPLANRSRKAGITVWPLISEVSNQFEF